MATKRGAGKDFDLQALYAAIDEQRRSRGLSWAGVTREINGYFQDIPRSRPIATSTIIALRDKRIGEGDGILQMLRWLGRPPESFVPDMKWDARAELRKPADKHLRFDTKALYAALNEQREARRLSWGEVAHQAGVSVNSLRYLSRGERTHFPMVMRIIGWLGRPVACFTRISDW